MENIDVSSNLQSVNEGQNQLQRIDEVQFKKIERLLIQAENNPTRKQKFQYERLLNIFPHLYVLRELDGYTFKQLTSHLNRVGHRLSLGEVREYYSQFCQAQMETCKVALETEKRRIREIQEIEKQGDQLSG